MMGFENLTKNAYFDQLLGYQSESDELPADETEADRPSEVDHGNVSESGGQKNHTIMTDQLLPAFILSPQDTIPLFSAELGGGTSLVPTDTDDDSLRKELEEEAELDKVDQASMLHYESELWKQYKKEI